MFTGGRIPARVALICLLAVVSVCALPARVVASSDADPSLKQAEKMADTGEQGNNSPTLLGPDLGAAIWQIVLFLLMLAVLSKFVWPKVLAGLKDREQKIRDDLNAAERASVEAQAKLDQYRRMIIEAREQSRAMVEQARLDAETAALATRESTLREIEHMHHRATREIHQARRQAMQEIYNQSAILATRVAEQILKREVNAKDARQLVDQAILQIEQSEKAG